MIILSPTRVTWIDLLFFQLKGYLRLEKLRKSREWPSQNIDKIIQKTKSISPEMKNIKKTVYENRYNIFKITVVVVIFSFFKWKNLNYERESIFPIERIIKANLIQSATVRMENVLLWLIF